MSAPSPVAAIPRPRPAASPLVQVLKPLASLQLTVALFALSMVLVFFATVAMMTKGLWTVVDEYFRSFVVWIPLDLVRKFCTVFLADVGNFPKDGSPWAGSVPFPAGWAIGFAMLVNLLAAHLVRFKLSWKRSGIILLHAGVILLMAGELVTGLFAVESTMTIQKREANDYLDVTREFEIAVTDASDPATDRVTVVPHTRLTKPGTVVSHPELPFDLRVEEYWKNTDKQDLFADEGEKALANDRNAVAMRSLKAPMINAARLTPRPESAGVDGDARSDIPTVRVTALEKETGKELGTHLLSLWAYPNFEMNRRVDQFADATVTAGGKAYTLLLRNKRVYLPYTVELLDFEHGKYPGTEIAKDFASTVKVREKGADAGREHRIWMNNPLRYAGVSMYQHAVVYNDSGTVLQVVSNPAAWWPYISCAMITLGMLVHFCITLSRFLDKPRQAGTSSFVQSIGPWWTWAASGGVVLISVAVVFVKMLIASRSLGEVVSDSAASWPFITGGLLLLGVMLHTCVTPLLSAGKSVGPRWLPWVLNGVIVVGLVGWFAANARPPKPTPEGVDLYAFGELPVRESGRVMPLDTLARTSLQSISEYTEVKKLEGTQVKASVSAIRWLADVLDTPTGDWRTGPGAKHQVFRIEHHQLLGNLELPPRPGFFRYSLDELRPKFDKIMAEFAKVEQKKREEKALDLYDSKVEELGTRLKTYQRLAQARELELIPPADGGDWTRLRAADKQTLDTLPEADRQTLLARLEKIDTALKNAYWERKEEEFTALMKKYGGADNVPNEVRERLRDEADRLQEEIGGEQQAAVQEVVRTRRTGAAGTFTALLDAARNDKGEAFQTALTKYRTEHLAGVPAGDLTKAKAEAYWLDQLAPFYYAEWFYGFAAGLALLGWLFWRPLNHGALALMLFTFALHTLALALRVWIQGRPPVTNLYASAVFIGWGCVLLSLVLEVIYRNGVANLVGGLIGLTTCKVAYFLGGSGDTMKMLVAVLDTNFWLTVHVLTVTAGYMGTFLTGGLATLYLIGRFVIFARNLLMPDRPVDLSAIAYLPRMTYGVLCFALLLSFFGTVSGGIWADYSWGRFWGWDPKENGAVLIVIWNALILHARWCGLVKDRGVAVLALVGNMVTAWSWFGTNQLQIGLHSYGFDNRLASGCFLFWVSQLAVMALALVPTPKKAAPPLAKRV